MIFCYLRAYLDEFFFRYQKRRRVRRDNDTLERCRSRALVLSDFPSHREDVYSVIQRTIGQRVGTKRH
jgi:hypothetical protein